MSRLDQTNEQEIRDSLWTCSLENSAIYGKRPLHHRRIHLGRINSLGITRNHTHREPLVNCLGFCQPIFETDRGVIPGTFSNNRGILGVVRILESGYLAFDVAFKN